jgi:hypothetical protein
MLKIYTASKIDHAFLWQTLHEEWPEFHFVARWPFYIGRIPETNTSAASKFWLDDETDVRNADVVLVYAANKNEFLRGALTEAGMGLALGKTVLVVGDNPSFSTWQYHPRCVRLANLEAARTYLRSLSE